MLEALKSCKQIWPPLTSKIKEKFVYLKKALQEKSGAKIAQSSDPITYITTNIYDHIRITRFN